MRSSLSGSSHFCRRIVRHLVIQSTVQSTCWTLTLSSRVFREDMFMEIGRNVLGWSTLIIFLRGLMQKIRGNIKEEYRSNRLLKKKMIFLFLPLQSSLPLLQWPLLLFHQLKV